VDNLHSAPDQQMADRLGLNRKGKRRRRLFWIIGIVIAVAAIGLLVVSMGAKPVHTYAFKQVARGDLAVTVSATGTLAPRDQVDVGSEVSGKIDKLEADFNDHVKKGEVLARINTDQLKAQLDQARATLSQAEATLLQMTQTHDRYTALERGNALSKEQLNVS
jgi:HlyD family secretion protein